MPFPDKFYSVAVGDFTWRLTRRFRYITPEGTIITAPYSFETDLASVPKIVWNIYSPNGAYRPAAVIHDWLYWKQQYTREQADELLKIMMLELNINRFTVYTFYWGVRLGGWVRWNKREEERKKKFKIYPV